MLLAAERAKQKKMDIHELHINMNYTASSNNNNVYIKKLEEQFLIRAAKGVVNQVQLLCC